MRWTIRIGLIALLAWAAFMVSPFVALYSLAKAVDAQDIPAISERVNFHALRLSLSKQIVSEYLRTVGRGQELDSFNRNLATSAGATIADPLVAQLVTPEAVAGLLKRRLPAQIRRASAAGSSPLLPDFTSFDRALNVFVTSESRGFRNIFIPVPDDRPKAEQARLHLRLVGTTWRLMGVELPPDLLQVLVKQLPRATS
jgi:hypothetical protein